MGVCWMLFLGGKRLFRQACSLRSLITESPTVITLGHGPALCVFCLLAFLELASSQVTITVMPSNYVNENDFVMTTCSYPIQGLARYNLAVNGILGPAIPFAARLNFSELYTILSTLEGNFTLIQTLLWTSHSTLGKSMTDTISRAY